MIRRIRRPPRSPMSSVTRIKQQKRTLVDRHIEADNLRGFAQALATLAPLAALWYAAALSAGVSYWLTAGLTLPMGLFVLRAFLLMHDCGHGSLFRTARLNKAFGFIFGVVWGMPQYVWSQHHAFHHATNGNWAKYSGPLAIVSVKEYAAMTDRQQRRYQGACGRIQDALLGFRPGILAYVLEQRRAVERMGADVLDRRTRAVFCRVRNQHIVGRRSGAGAVHGAA